MKKSWKYRLWILLASLSLFALAACDELLALPTTSNTSSTFSSRSEEIRESSSFEEEGEESSSCEEDFSEESSIEESSSCEEDFSEENSSAEEDSEESSSSEEEGEESSSGGGSSAVAPETPVPPSGEPIARDLTPPEPTEQYSYQKFQASGDEWYCSLYTDFYRASKSFHTSNENCDVRTVSDSAGNDYQCFTVATINYAKYYTDAAKTQKVSFEQCISVWVAFAQENPYFFWIDKIICAGNEGEAVFVGDAEYATYQSRKDAQTAIDGMVDECASYLYEGMSEIEIALTVYDYLAWKMDYAYIGNTTAPETAQWAHCLAGAATGKGVCESYAHAYDYLCGVFGLECMTVVGVAGDKNVNLNAWGGHAWNYVQINESWYVVDVTWGDPYKRQENTFYREWFGEYGEDYTSTHLPDTPTSEWGIYYQVELPDVYGELCPVLCGKEGEEKMTYSSIESALASMEEGGRYEIILYPPTTVTLAWTGVTVVDTYATLFVTELPNVESITFIGGAGENGYLFVDPDLDRTKIQVDGITIYLS